MIESSPFTNNIVAIDVSQDQYTEIADGIRDSEYTRNKSYGFVPEAIDSDFLSAHLVLTTPVVVQSFNEQTREVEDQEVDRTELIPFRIDFEHQFLEVFSNQNDTSKVVTRLSQLTNWSVTISDINLNLSELHCALMATDFDIDTTSLRISNFSLNEHTNGSCHLKVFEENEVQRLMDEYNTDVTYLGTQFDIRDEEISIGFYRGGTIRFYSKTKEDDELMTSIKQLMKGMAEGNTHA